MDSFDQEVAKIMRADIVQQQHQVAKKDSVESHNKQNFQKQFQETADERLSLAHLQNHQNQFKQQQDAVVDYRHNSRQQHQLQQVQQQHQAKQPAQYLHATPAELQQLGRNNTNCRDSTRNGTGMGYGSAPPQANTQVRRYYEQVHLQLHQQAMYSNDNSTGASMSIIDQQSRVGGVGGVSGTPKVAGSDRYSGNTTTQHQNAEELQKHHFHFNDFCQCHHALPLTNQQHSSTSNVANTNTSSQKKLQRKVTQQFESPSAAAAKQQQLQPYHRARSSCSSSMGMATGAGATPSGPPRNLTGVTAQLSSAGQNQQQFKRKSGAVGSSHVATVATPADASPTSQRENNSAANLP